MKGDTIWLCDCGFSGSADVLLGGDFRWNGSTWQHHHGYPVGHVDMRAVHPPGPCAWREESDYSCWETACGNAYCFEYDFRNERNGYKFCPGCGREIECEPIREEAA